MLTWIPFCFVYNRTSISYVNLTCNCLKLLSRLFTWANYALLFLPREYCNGNLFPHKDTFNDLLRIKYCLSSISDNCQEMVRGGMLLHAIALFFRNINKNRRKSCNIQWWKCALFSLYLVYITLLVLFPWYAILN